MSVPTSISLAQIESSDKFQAILIAEAVTRAVQVSGICYSFGKRIVMDVTVTSSVEHAQSLFVRDATYRSATGIYSAQMSLMKLPTNWVLAQHYSIN